MKRLVLICLILTFCLLAQYAFCQVKGDFSDWNVPPPVPAGTIPKGTGGVKQTAVQLPTDISAPNLKLTDIKLAALSPVLQNAPDVQAPAQPQFPPMPFETPDIPLPQVPQAMGLPKQTLHDEILDIHTDMPEPQAPEMPALPKTPSLNQKSVGQEPVRFPLVPAILVEPGTTTLPADDFPFMAWPVPGIPESSEINTTPVSNINEDKIKPVNKKKTAKKLKGG